MKTIQELIKEKIENLGKNEQITLKKKTRNDLIAKLYEVYILENKYENYFRYKFWLKKNKKIKNIETIEEFKKEKLSEKLKYHKPIASSFFAIKLAHIPTDDLWYLISTKKDLVHRKGYTRSSFTKWLFYAIK